MAIKKSDFLQNSIIIAAHPDDELLWFNSILEQVDQVLLVFEDYWPDPSLGEARRSALEKYPHSNIRSLKVAQAATFGCADWSMPKLSPEGLQFGKTVIFRDLKQTAKRLIGKSCAPPEGIKAHYQRNYRLVYEALKPVLTSDMNVFTHNPWGEYGHEDHVQLFRIVSDLRSEIGFTQWMSNYCTDRSLPLAMTYFDYEARDWVEQPTNITYAEKVACVFRESGCWTWRDDWKWFRTECFIPAPHSQARPGPQRSLLPLNMFNM